jgi:hypothetical protein
MVDKTGLNWTVVYGVKVSPFYGDCKDEYKWEAESTHNDPS